MKRRSREENAGNAKKNKGGPRSYKSTDDESTMDDLGDESLTQDNGTIDPTNEFINKIKNKIESIPKESGERVSTSKAVFIKSKKPEETIGILQRPTSCWRQHSKET